MQPKDIGPCHPQDGLMPRLNHPQSAAPCLCPALHLHATADGNALCCLPHPMCPALPSHLLADHHADLVLRHRNRNGGTAGCSAAIGARPRAHRPHVQHVWRWAAEGATRAAHVPRVQRAAVLRLLLLASGRHGCIAHRV